MSRVRNITIVFLLLQMCWATCRPEGRSFLLIDRIIPCSILVDLESCADAETALKAFSQGTLKDEKVYFKALAAIELRHYLARMMRRAEADIPIIDDRVSVVGNVIFIGLPGENSAYENLRSELSKRWRRTAGHEAQGMRCDTFHEPQRNILALSGRTAVANLYAVYDWLEEHGVRWPAPGKDGEIVPVRADIIVPPCRLYKEPAMIRRGFVPGCGHGEFLVSDRAMLQWLMRNRINLLPAEAHADSVLHRYGIHTARSIAPQAPQPAPGNAVCVGRSQRLTRSIDSLVTVAAPYADVLVVDAKTIPAWCDCPACSSLGNETDKSLLLFAAVATAMEKLQQTGDMPQTCRLLGIVDVKIPDRPLPSHWRGNLIDLAVHVFPRCYDHSMTDPHCTEVNYLRLKMLDYWLKAKHPGRVGVVEGYHAVEFSGLPLAFSQRMREDIPFYQEIGIGFLLAQQPDFYHPGVNALTDWQLARQCWRSDTDVDTLESEFFAVYYPGVPQVMREYYKMLQEALANISAWRYELPRRLDEIAQNGFVNPLLPLDLFRRHFAFEYRFTDDNFGTDWQRTYQLIHDARHVLDEALTRSVRDQTADHLIAAEEQLRFAEMTITLYDNVIRVLTLGEDEPEMREEAAIRLRATTQKMDECRLLHHPCGAKTALEASGIAEACRKLCRVLDERHGRSFEQVYD